MDSMLEQLNSLSYDELLKQITNDTVKEEPIKETKSNLNFGGGGPNPKLKTVSGETYFMNNKVGNYLLLDNNNSFERLQIKCRLWKLNDELINESIERYRKNNSSKTEKYYNILKNSVYFRYMEICFRDDRVLIDMNDLSVRRFTNRTEFKSYDLPEEESYMFNDFELTKKKNYYKKGLLIGENYTEPVRLTQRNIKITLSNKSKLIIRLARDRKNVVNRNCIELSYEGEIDFDNYSGLLIKKELSHYENNHVLFTHFSRK